MKQIIVDKYLSGQKYTDFGRDLKIPRNSIHSVIQRYLARGTEKRALRSGRKQNMDDLETRKFLRIVKSRRTLLLSGITEITNQYFTIKSRDDCMKIMFR